MTPSTSIPGSLVLLSSSTGLGAGRGAPVGRPPPGRPPPRRCGPPPPGLGGPPGLLGGGIQSPFVIVVRYSEAPLSCSSARWARESPPMRR